LRDAAQRVRQRRQPDRLAEHVGHPHHAIDAETSLDAIEMSIAVLRVGAALATANLLVLHPTTWSAIRRSKDGQDRYLATADPTTDEANSVWGVPVLTTTVIAEGTGVLSTR
jgi:HK97 family phage major capsid protein